MREVWRCLDVCMGGFGFREANDGRRGTMMDYTLLAEEMFDRHAAAWAVAEAKEDQVDAIKDARINLAYAQTGHVFLAEKHYNDFLKGR